MTLHHMASKGNVVADLLLRSQNTQSQIVMLTAMVENHIWLPTSDNLFRINHYRVQIALRPRTRHCYDMFSGISLVFAYASEGDYCDHCNGLLRVLGSE